MKRKSDTVTVTEICERLGLSRGSTYGALRAGSIPCITIGRRRICPRAAFEEWLKTAGRRSHA